MLVNSGGGDLLQNVLNAERSLYLNVGLSGGGDPLLNVLNAERSPYLSVGYC